jgi:hypothetical protein
MSKLLHTHLKLGEAQAFVQHFHRHSKPLKRHMFSIGVHKAGLMYGAGFHEQYGFPLGLIGIATVDRCSSAWSKFHGYIELRRLCVNPKHSDTHAASYLVGKVKQACFAMGYKVIVTYTRPNESGASLMGAGFIMNQWKVQHDGEGTITEGLVRWICIDGRQPDVEDREFARRGLDRMKELSGAL